ncbi:MULTISPECIES: hypothetical protein [unclassified Ruegeria]|uniref:hypothetical protein n=1 Tax=unclassified Ruegeria TaxID=2625375 RepID=UPI0014928595|nr:MULTISPECIES: hypothetical protein [unclassified Ruegeria]NOD84497.1 hypothetical protein [Ruegeria sp. HKCCD6119]
MTNTGSAVRVSSNVAAHVVQAGKDAVLMAIAFHWAAPIAAAGAVAVRSNAALPVDSDVRPLA